MKSVETYKELSHRLDQLVGVPFAELADFYDIPWRGTATHNKGWAGRIVDSLTGADVGNAPKPDISHLGIEVKSIPIGEGATVLEPTKVTSLNYAEVRTTGWWQSTAFHKLRCVLFVPIVKFDPTRPDEWFIRRPFLWLPNERTVQQFEEDYNSVRQIVTNHDFERISSAKPPNGQGLYLHPKPAAQNARSRRTYAIDGQEFRLLPRAWMLRESFTRPIVLRNLKVDLKLSASDAG